MVKPVNLLVGSLRSYGGRSQESGFISSVAHNSKFCSKKHLPFCFPIRSSSFFHDGVNLRGNNAKMCLAILLTQRMITLKGISFFFWFCNHQGRCTSYIVSTARCRANTIPDPCLCDRYEHAVYLNFRGLNHEGNRDKKYGVNQSFHFLFPFLKYKQQQIFANSIIRCYFFLRTYCFVCFPSQRGKLKTKCLLISL